MKTFFIVLFTLSASFSFAQAGYQNAELLAGLSTNNSKFVSLLFEKESVKRFGFVYSAEAIRYSTAASRYDFNGNDYFVSGGIFLSSKLSNARNFNAKIFSGAMAGTDNHYFIWYPVIGFKQNIFLSPRFSLLFMERGAYIFNLPQYNWQASLHIGCRWVIQ